MFRKIRRNFIFISLASASLILLVSIGAINIINYHNIDVSSDQIIEKIYREKLSPEPVSNEPPKPGEIGDSSYFIAVKENGTLKIDEASFHIRSFSMDEALKIATTVDSSGGSEGYYSYYRYNLIDNKYIFLDATSRFESAQNFLLVSVFASLGGLLAFFLLIFFASKFVLKPVKESYEKQKRFITNASHELKTPLTIISANNELLEMNNVQNEYTDNISTQIDRMNKIIKDLVNYSRMNEIKHKCNVEINLSNLINKITESFKIVFTDINLELESEIEDNVFIKSDPEIINQMILIIMDNARKYANTKVKIYLKKSFKQIIFHEENDTFGVEEGNLNFYTERFYRSETVRSSDGSGIGLSILNEISKKNKIKLKLYGCNNVFHIKLIFKSK